MANWQNVSFFRNISLKLVSSWSRHENENSLFEKFCSRFRGGAIILPEFCLFRVTTVFVAFVGLYFRKMPDLFYRKNLALSILIAFFADRVFGFVNAYLWFDG